MDCELLNLVSWFKVEWKFSKIRKQISSKYFGSKMDKECYLGKHRYGAESDLHTDSIETPSFITYSMELPHDPTDFNKNK